MILEPQQQRLESPKEISTAYYLFRSLKTKTLYVRVLKEDIFGVFADNQDFDKWVHLTRRLERLSSNDPMNLFYDLVGETPENTKAEKERVFSRFPYNEYQVDDEDEFKDQFADFINVELVLTDEERNISGVKSICLSISPEAFQFVNAYRPDRSPILGLSFYNASIEDYWEIKEPPHKYPDSFISIFIRYNHDFINLYEGDNIFHPRFFRELLASDEFDEKTVFLSKNSNSTLDLTQMRRVFII